MLTENVRIDDLSDLFENVSFIIFNYDRCVEHYLYNALQDYYAIGAADAQQLMAGLAISHPYGMVGSLPWQGHASVEFGGRMNVQLLDIAKEIRTFTERMEDNEALAVIRRRIEEAETIVFLGFAFHPLNMKLLAPGVRSHAKRVFATAKGISNTDMVVVERSVIDTLQVDAQHANGTLTVMTRNDLTCVGLFEEYWRASPKGFDFLSRSSGAIKHLVPGSKGDSRPTAEIEHLRLAVVGIDDG